jgi:hypothetical protein
MEITCSRCHQAVPEDSCFCPACGLPQLVYSADGTEVPAEADRLPPAPREAGAVEWKPALRLTVLLTLPACLLFCALTPFGFLGFLWMGAVAALTVALYSRGKRQAWITVGAGARIGLVTGLTTGWMVFALVSATLYSTRYFLHQGPEMDELWRNMISLRLDPQWQASGMDPHDIATLNSFLLSPEGRSDTLLSGLGLVEAILLLSATAGGAIAARMMIRTRRPLP